MEWMILMAGSDLGLAISLFAGVCVCVHKSERTSVKWWTASYDRITFALFVFECIFWFYIEINLFASVCGDPQLGTWLGYVFVGRHLHIWCRWICLLNIAKKSHEECDGIDMTTAKYHLWEGFGGLLGITEMCAQLAPIWWRHRITCAK